MRIAGFRPTSLFDGPGINAVVFFQGCGHRCEKCQNPGTWSFEGGKEVTMAELIGMVQPYLGFITGVTLSGGDPIYQFDEINEFAAWAKRKGLRVILYSGFEFEEISHKIPLDNVDIVIDGQYIDEEKTTEQPFRGSWNQEMYVKTVDGWVIQH